MCQQDIEMPKLGVHDVTDTAVQPHDADHLDDEQLKAEQDLDVLLLRYAPAAHRGARCRSSQI